MKAVLLTMRRGLVSMALSCPFLWLASCGSGLTVNTLLNDQLEEVLGNLDREVLMIRVINQTGENMDLDLLVDGLPIKIFCSAQVGLCNSFLPDCPLEVKAVQQRLLDAQGRFIGGLNFNDSPSFTFTTGEFDCGSVIVFQFSEGQAEAFAL